MCYYYSVIRVNGPIVLVEDPEGDLQVFTKDFFDFDVQENDLAYLQDHIFRKAEAETEKVKEENFDKMQQLFGKE